MNYIMFMVQHTKSQGDVIANPSPYATNDEWKGAYHHEMDYAISNEDFIGLSTLVTDLSLNKVFEDNWVREPAPIVTQPQEQAEPQGE